MKSLKLLFLLASFLMSLLANGQQSQTFDIIRYQSPVGWEQSSTDQTLTLSTEDGQGNFCLITLYKSIESVNDPVANFKMSWGTLVQPVLGTGNAIMQPGSEDQGWVSAIGSAPFEKEGIAGAAILISSTRESVLINTVILTNTDRWQSEIEKFLDEMTLFTEPSHLTAKEGTESRPQVWMNMQSSFFSTPDYFRSGINPKFYIVYPNGDYYPHFPTEGLLTFDPNNKNDSWGKFTLSGSSGSFLSKYEEIYVEKISESEMKKVGYSLNFYKCVVVDGLRLEGQWGRFVDWRKDPVSGNAAGINSTGVRQVIEFKRDGTFSDYGVFLTNLLLPDQYPDQKPGRGSYQIENFTLVLRYQDGRVVHKAFSGVGNVEPTQENRLIYIGTQPFYSN